MKRVLTLFVLIAVGVVFSSNVYNIVLGLRDHEIYYSGAAVPPQIRQGEDLRVTYTFDHLRFCDQKPARFIISRSTGEVFYRDQIQGGATGLGRRTTVNTVQMKRTDGRGGDIPPGQYVLRMSSIAECSDGHHVVDAPEIYFEIIP